MACVISIFDLNYRLVYHEESKLTFQIVIAQFALYDLRDSVRRPHHESNFSERQYMSEVEAKNRKVISGYFH